MGKYPTWSQQPTLTPSDWTIIYVVSQTGRICPFREIQATVGGWGFRPPSRALSNRLKRLETLGYLVCERSSKPLSYGPGPKMDQLKEWGLLP